MTTARPSAGKSHYPIRSDQVNSSDRRRLSKVRKDSLTVWSHIVKTPAHHSAAGVEGVLPTTRGPARATSSGKRFRSPLASWSSASWSSASRTVTRGIWRAEPGGLNLAGLSRFEPAFPGMPRLVRGSSRDDPLGGPRWIRPTRNGETRCGPTPPPDHSRVGGARRADTTRSRYAYRARIQDG